jgi:hypothetical protein
VPGRPLRETTPSIGVYEGLATSHQGKNAATVSEISAVPDGQGSGYAVVRVPLEKYLLDRPGDLCTPDAVVARTPGGIEDPSSHHAVVNAIIGRR